MGAGTRSTSPRSNDGEDYETAVYYPEDERYLVEHDDVCKHYEVVSGDAP
jgi:hypothetical protein